MFSAWGSTQSMTMHATINGAFEEKNPEVKVNVVYMGFYGLWEKLMSGLMVGKVPDLMESDVESQVYGMAEENLLVPLDEIAKKLGGENYEGWVPRFEECCSWEGHIYVLPWNVMATGLWVRTDLSKNAGLDFPKSWDDYLHAAEVLTVDIDGDGTIDRYGTALGLKRTGYIPDAEFLPYFWSTGGTVLDEKGEVAIDKGKNLKGAVDTLNFLKQLTKYAPPGSAAHSYFEVQATFAADKAAMVNYWFRVLLITQERNPDLLPHIRFILQPSQKPGLHSPSGNFAGISILSGSENIDLAKKYCEFFFQRRNRIRTASAIPILFWPTLKDLSWTETEELRSLPLVQTVLNTQPETLPIMQKAMDIKRGINYEHRKKYTLATDIIESKTIEDMVIDVCITGVDAETAVRQAAAKMRKIVPE